MAELLTVTRQLFIKLNDFYLSLDKIINMKDQLRYQAMFYRFFEAAKKDLRPSTIALVINLSHNSPQDLHLLRLTYNNR